MTVWGTTVPMFETRFDRITTMAHFQPFEPFWTPFEPLLNLF